MKWAPPILIAALALCVSAALLFSGNALAGGGDKSEKDFEKALDESMASIMKFLEKHPDSEQAEGARYIAATIFTRYSTEEWQKKNLKMGKALLADLEEAEHRTAKTVKGKILDIELLKGEPPPPIEVTALDGKPLSLSDYKGKVLLIDFWATWCGPCIRELPNVKEVYEKYKEKGFDILGISLDQDRGRLESFLESESMPWRQVFDGKGWQNEVAGLYGVTSIPKTYLLDQNGKVVKIGLRGEDLGKEVARLLEGN
jgi:thiol-disulfide isomerase/thioredoxin